MRPAVLALVTILSFVLAACVVAEPGRSTSSGPSAPTGPSAPAGMIVVGVGDLPPELAATLALIDAGGPFPYPQDGSTFQNREGLLPERPEGHYREYTVPTPGEDDRGARRIVTGAHGERYWTADHYASFAWIAP
jgi:ribonuclease T1